MRPLSGWVNSKLALLGQFRVSTNNEARESAATARGPHVKLEIEHRKEISAHRTTKWMLNVFSVIAFVLLVLLVGCVLLWWFVLR